VLPHTHLIAFLSLVERLPDRKRLQLLSEYCRELPTLDNARLAHDALAVSNLESLLRKSNGLTLIRGGTDFQRTFLLTAMGHSFPRIGGPGATVHGLDLHEPRKWVPLEDMVYFKEPLRHARLKELIDAVWPEIQSSKAPLLLLNSIWSLVPHLHNDILNMARSQHVVVSDAKPPPPADLARRLETSVHTITISPARESERLIHLDVEII
jgi:hypothetical protein